MLNGAAFSLAVFRREAVSSLVTQQVRPQDVLCLGTDVDHSLLLTSKLTLRLKHSTLGGRYGNRRNIIVTHTLQLQIDRIEETFKNVIFIQSPININIRQDKDTTDYPTGKTNDGFHWLGWIHFKKTFAESC